MLLSTVYLIDGRVYRGEIQQPFATYGIDILDVITKSGMKITNDLHLADKDNGVQTHTSIPRNLIAKIETDEKKI